MLSPKAQPLQNTGYCHCCRGDTTFQINDEWLRDHYICTKCNSIPRQRHIQYVLDSYLPGWEQLTIHESSPSNDFISRQCRSYSSSYYFQGVERGSIHNGARCEDLENLTFDDNTFDIVITQDVFEHIFNPALGAREIKRVLKPGGVHVFTAPKHKGIRKSYPRARLDDGKIVYLKEEMYHGNPIGDGKALVTWDYGDDFEFLLHQWSGMPTITYVTRDRNLGLDGEYLEVFVSAKRQSTIDRYLQYVRRRLRNLKARVRRQN
ncbi:MAG TPA: class I SAM-dependent methyltransferase [Blastocatellia bacterium]|nr:class I SAM-dependent methyltransferase [Blastocatellia bacterium]